MLPFGQQEGHGPRGAFAGHRSVPLCRALRGHSCRWPAWRSPPLPCPGPPSSPVPPAPSPPFHAQGPTGRHTCVHSRGGCWPCAQRPLCLLISLHSLLGRLAFAREPQGRCTPGLTAAPEAWAWGRLSRRADVPGPWLLWPAGPQCLSPWPVTFRSCRWVPAPLGFTGCGGGGGGTSKSYPVFHS